jgi:Mannosyltransferase (PIG-V)
VLQQKKAATHISGLRFVLAVYVASRIFYLVSGFLLAKFVPTSSHQLTTTDMPPGSLSIWSHWDGEHYVALAMDGYFQAPRDVSPAFFPMYPLLLKSISELSGGSLSKEALSYCGPLLSLIFLPLAFYFIYEIAREGWGEAAAKGAVLTLGLFPTTFFLNATYTESLFLALSAGSLWAIRVKRNLLLACILAGLATATRNVAIFLAAPLMYEWIKQGGLREPRDRWRGLYLAFVPSGLIVYAGYLWIKFGDPLLFYSSQKYWKREATGPFTTANRAWDSAVEGVDILRDPALWTQPSVQNLADHLERANSLYNLAFLIFTLVVLLAGLRKLPLSLTIYSLLLIVPPALFGTPDMPLMGIPRYVLVAFPVFIVLGLLARKKLLFAGWLVLSTIMSIILCALFVSWRFVA